jgi:hypothetical protein
MSHGRVCLTEGSAGLFVDAVIKLNYGGNTKCYLFE